ncbi:MAG TPA: hypothetical protein VK543_15565 [Puia sp.]|nr:hypothetical protein [Puia sp.]
MFFKWLLGNPFGSDRESFKNDRVANEMRNSPGVDKAREKFYKLGLTSGHYDCGLSGIGKAGFNPIQQFVGSFDWNIVVKGNTLEYSLTNTTGLWSAAFHLTPHSWDDAKGPMGNFTQTYIFTEAIKK